MKRVAFEAVILVENLYEDLELWYPFLRLKEAGADVSLVGPEAGKEYRGKHGYPVRTDRTPDQVDPAGVDVLIIPGGYAPDYMRRHPEMVQLVREIHESGGLVAFICHGGWMAVSADILKNRRATSFFAIRDDMINAGAEWVDEAVVQDGTLISSRTPQDLPDFCEKILRFLDERG